MTPVVLNLLSLARRAAATVQAKLVNVPQLSSRPCKSRSCLRLDSFRRCQTSLFAASTLPFPSQ
eukprot:5714051-Amphidinium_carterae.1